MQTAFNLRQPWVNKWYVYNRRTVNLMGLEVEALENKPEKKAEEIFDVIPSVEI